MTEILAAIAVLITTVLAVIERAKRKNAEKKLQDEVDLLNENPSAWLHAHLPGKRVFVDKTKSDSPDAAKTSG